MTQNDMLMGIVVGAAAAAIGAVIAYRYIGTHPVGGGQPQQWASMSPTNVITPQVPGRTATYAAPVVQNTPITEAAYNQYATDHQPAFGQNANVAAEETQVVIPW